MKNAQEVVATLLAGKKVTMINNNVATAFAPTNIALVKYWGKRNSELNLPLTSSISLSLASIGTLTQISVSDTAHDIFLLNDNLVDPTSEFSQKLTHYLSLFRPYFDAPLKIATTNHLPVAAGFASSASGFAALALALNQFLGFDLTATQLSILARLGSGSACRSLWNGFVKWEMGNQDEGMDSHGIPLAMTWPELRLGLLTVSSQEKPISSRKAMQCTVETSTLYSAWPKQVDNDLANMLAAIQDQDFLTLGTVAEQNALAMHATMLSSWPPILYWQGETLALVQKIWRLRNEGLPLYFTQDAGPNLKLLFLEKDSEVVQREFPGVGLVVPFAEAQ